MSTGLDCYFQEHRQGWFYFLEQWDSREEYDQYGPFPSFDAAYNHLSRNHANPGGFSRQPRDHSLDMDAAMEALRSACPNPEDYDFVEIDEGMTREVVARSKETVHIPQVYVNIPAQDKPVREVTYTPASDANPSAARGSVAVVVRSGEDSRGQGHTWYGKTDSGWGDRDEYLDDVMDALPDAFGWSPPPPKPPRRYNPYRVGRRW